MFQKFDQFQIGVLKPSSENHVFTRDLNIGTNETWNLGGHGFKVQLQIVCHMLHVHHLFFAKCVPSGQFNSTKVTKSITMLEKKTYFEVLKKFVQNIWVVITIIEVFFKKQLQAK